MSVTAGEIAALLERRLRDCFGDSVILAAMMSNRATVGGVNVDLSARRRKLVLHRRAQIYVPLVNWALLVGCLICDRCLRRSRSGDR